MAKQELKKTLKRIEKDLQQFTTSPLPNMSATPLESNMLEWHCNIRHHTSGDIYHLVLFLPKDYPCSAPRLEVWPRGFQMNNVVSRHGEKGTQICLNVFSDFADTHSEWKFENGSGWSPAYTVQTVLLVFISYINDNYKSDDPMLKYYLEGYRYKNFVCPDCEHCLEKPFPPLYDDDSEEGEEKGHDDNYGHNDNDDNGCCSKINVNINTGEMPETSEAHDKKSPESESERASDSNEDKNYAKIVEEKIFDYVSREKFSPTDTCQDHVFGYGISSSEHTDVCRPTSPYEFLTASSFYEMCNAFGRGKSIYKESISYFLPLYISASHGAKIKRQFDKTATDMAKQFRFKYRFALINNRAHVMISVFGHLLSSFMTKMASSYSLQSNDDMFDGFFQIHRMFMWVVDTYPTIRKCVNQRIKWFLSDPNKCFHKRTSKYDFQYFLVLLSVNTKYSWESVAEIYVKEHWKHALAYYFYIDRNLCSMNLPVETRIQRTFEFTKFPCETLAFHLTFYKIIRPNELSKEAILQRYDDYLGFPSPEVLSNLRTSFAKIPDCLKSLDVWYRFMGLSMPSQEILFSDFKEAVKFAMKRKNIKMTKDMSEPSSNHGLR